MKEVRRESEDGGGKGSADNEVKGTAGHLKKKKM